MYVIHICVFMIYFYILQSGRKIA